MDKLKEIAEVLDGSEYPLSFDPKVVNAAKESGIVIVFGQSDDLMEFRGAIYEELDCYEGGTAYLTDKGLLSKECDDDDCPYIKREKQQSKIIEAVWDRDGIPWQYDTDIPHETFKVMEDGEVYCIGIVFYIPSEEKFDDDATVLELEVHKQIRHDYAGIIHNMVVGMQSAWIEWQHGQGAENAMLRITNMLAGPGHIPDENEPYGKDPEMYYAANRHDPYPVCFCGKPSVIMCEGKGYCCEEHFNQREDR